MKSDKKSVFGNRIQSRGAGKIKAIALGEICIMILSSIAFAFIIGGMGVLSLSGVSAEDKTFTPITVNGITYYYWVNPLGGEVEIYSDNSGNMRIATASDVTGITSAITNYANANSAGPANPPVDSGNSMGAERQAALAEQNRQFIESTAASGTQNKPAVPAAATAHSGNTLGTSTVINQQDYQRMTLSNRIIPIDGNNYQISAIQKDVTTGNYILYGADGNRLKINGQEVLPQTAEALTTAGINPTRLKTINGVTYNLNENNLGGAVEGQTNPDVQFLEDNPGFAYDPHANKVYKVSTSADGQSTTLTEMAAGNNNAPTSAGSSKEGGYTNPFSKNPIQNPVLGNFVEGISYASVVLTLTGLIAGFMTDQESKNMIQSVGLALTAGIIAGKSTAALLSIGTGAKGAGQNWATTNRNVWGTDMQFQWRSVISIGVAAATAYLTFASQYKKEKTDSQTLAFKCYNWQAPNGGSDCNKCNTDSQMPCSEYRCKSLGLTCKIINSGTSQERCIDGSRDDVTSPGIKPWDILPAGYAYSDKKDRPPGGESASAGHFKVTYNGGCLPAFTPFEFGIVTTDKGTSGDNIITQPAQCKIDFNHTKSFDEMSYYMGEDNLYVENHSQAMSLPGTDLLNKLYSDTNSSLAIKNDGEYTLYIRCKDGNGNENRDEFSVRFCVDPSEDTTAPIIKTTNIPTGSPVLYKADNLTINVYTNEPSECKWSRRPSSYSNMENQMTCNNEIWEMNAEFLYTCTTTLTGIKDKEENKFYFRCKDLSTRANEMQEDYEYSLIGTQPLNLLSVGPNGTITGATSTITVALTAKTDNGFRNGEAKCYYSPTDEENSYIEMVETGSNVHQQPLDLTNGDYNYNIKCVDAGGNTDYNKTSFKVFVDTYAPVVVRLYNFEERLTLITDEESTCRYSTQSCNFDVNKEGSLMGGQESKIHDGIWKTDQTYYVKCMDKNNNQPDPSECSVIVRPYVLSNEE